MEISAAAASVPVNSACPLFQVVVMRKEREDEEQAFLVDQLGRVAQQRRRDLPAEAAGEGLPQEVLEDQPDPADQHDDRQHLGEALCRSTMMKLNTPEQKPNRAMVRG